RRRAVRSEGLDAALQVPAADVLGAGDVALLDLLALADVDEQAGAEVAAGLLDAGLGDDRAGGRDEVTIGGCQQGTPPRRTSPTLYPRFHAVKSRSELSTLDSVAARKERRA